uniref:Uncharacterized protein n=1 Tax=Oryza meridionalis TaxID=40149 RepID=A0A0E0C2E0_9ORYZ
MDQHHVQQQQYVDPYRTMVLSPQPDHLNALQYNHQQQPQPPPQATPPPPQHHHASLASHFHLLHGKDVMTNFGCRSAGCPCSLAARCRSAAVMLPAAG